MGRPFRFGVQAPRTTDPGVWLDLAQEAAAVQILTNGRLELGVGAGWAKQEYLQTGIQFDEGKVRVGRFDEYLQVVKGLLAAREPYSFAGQWFTLDPYPPLPHLEYQPPPRIAVGGGSRQVLSVAGRLADSISVATRATPDGLFDFSNCLRIQDKDGPDGNTKVGGTGPWKWVEWVPGDHINDVLLDTAYCLTFSAYSNIMACSAKVRGMRWEPSTAIALREMWLA